MSISRRLAAASIVGTALEYYDFAIYNSLAALVFNRVFFPSFEPLTGTILAFSTFAVGYLSRPLGGLLFGQLGDRRGRRYVLTATLLLMGVATGLMGLLPSYAQAGIVSPMLLVALRFVQGMALGGEWAGAVLLSMEHGADGQRGRNASWAQAGPSLGTLLATASIALLTLLLPADAFVGWGWRLPFLACVMLVAFGLWVRRRVDETPLFRELRDARRLARAPLRAVLRDHWRALLVAGGARIGPDVLYSLLVAFALSYLSTVLQQSRTLALAAVAAGSAVNVLAVPYFGALSDRLGRRAVYAGGVLAALGWAFVFFRLLDSLAPALIVLAIAGGFLLHAVMYGPQGAFIAEQFPTRVRYTGASLAYTLVGIVGGGIAPLLFATIYRGWHSTLGLSLYLAAALAVSAGALLAARETSAVPLES